MTKQQQIDAIDQRIGLTSQEYADLQAAPAAEVSKVYEHYVTEYA